VLGLEWEYGAIECREPELEELLDTSGSEWRGFSLTMPLKDEARWLAAVVDPIAEESGVVNTLLRLADRADGPTWAGFNTDVGGLAAALDEADIDVSRTVVLGAGATAVSAVLAARALGAGSVVVLARRPEAAEGLATRFDGSGTGLRCAGYGLGDPQAENGEAFPGATAVISTLPGQAADSLVLPDRLLQTPMFDVAYDPWPSPLAERWRAAGTPAHSGLGMLVHQALLQLRIFVNGDPGLPLDRETGVLAAMRLAAGMGDGDLRSETGETTESEKR
jgi:shikimate dehydrogenase